MACIQSGGIVLRQLIRDTSFRLSDHMIHPLLFNAQGVRYRKLEVILTTSIEKLGKAGEMVKVAPGYFRNHLMPKLLAVPNIDKYAYLIREQRKIYQPDEVETVTVLPQTKEDKMKEYQMAAKRLDNARLSWKQKVDCSAQNPCKAQSNWIPSYTVWEKSDSLSIIRSHITVFHLFALIIESLRRLIKVDNDLRSPVTKDELVSEVARQLCVDVQPENLHLPSPLTTMGEYEVPLRLPRAIPLPVGKLNWTLKVKIRRK